MSLTKSERAQKGCLGLVFAALILVCGLALFTAAALDTFLKSVRKSLPKASSLARFEPSQTTRIYASNGQLIATLFRENRTWVPLRAVSPWMIKALLAIEDRSFYQHRGVDLRGVARAAYEAYFHHDKQGASTITMQLARAVFLTRDQTMQRKVKEALMAVEIEKQFTKNEIMELYLNQIYLGSGAYGVQAASSLYFNKKPQDLMPVEAAILAGLPQAPNDYSPLVDEKKCKDRAQVVLDNMKKYELLTPEQYGRATEQLRTLKFHNKDRQEFTVLKVPYFTTYVIKELYKRFDEDTLYRGGFSVQTTVDLAMQQRGEKLVRQMVAEARDSYNVHTASLVCIENKTGYLRTMVGGTGWTRANQFNRAFQARRQPGSSFKPFVYATALECGMSPDSVVPDTPITVDGWSPKNSDGRFMGPITLATALQNSRNVVSVRLAQTVGLKRIIDYAHAAGITEKLPEVLSLSLGSVEISPLEMASAYTVFPNAGLKIPTNCIKRITDAEGHVIEDNTVPAALEVFSEPTASNMVDMMKRVVEGGTAGNAMMPNHEVAGKTGTTDSFRDAWFNGYTAEYTTAVWVGNDDYARMWSSFGGDLPARLWHEFMVFAERNKKPSTIPRNHISKVCCLFCAESQMRAGPGCPKVYRKLMGRYDLPGQYCSTHGAPRVTYTGVARPSDDNRHDTRTTAARPKAKPQGDDSAPVPDQVELPPSGPGGGLDAPPSEPPPQTAPDSGPPPEPAPAPVPAEVPLEPAPAPPQPAAPPPEPPAETEP